MYKKKKIIALIPARKGSKGIKNKNILNLNGKPLIAYSINYAQNSNLIDKTFVTTDGKRIASISKRFGAEVIKRPKKISGDNISVEPTILHSIKYVEKKLNYNFDIIVFLQPTSPLRKRKEVDKAIKLLIDKKLDTVFSSNDYLPFIWKNNKNSFYPLNFNLSRRKRRQEIFTVNETGSFYVFTKKMFLQNKSRFGKKILNFNSEFLSSILEIDSFKDYKYISSLLKTNIPRKYNLFLP